MTILDQDQDIERPAEIRVIANSKCWIEGNALAQLKKAATLPGIRLAVGLPDLHAGNGRPIGSVFASTELFYPDMIGTDIGCGVACWQSDLKVIKAKIDKLARKLQDMGGHWDGDAASWLAEYDIPATGFEHSLGTIGAGNHFAEFQKVEKIIDAQCFDRLGLDKKRLMLTIHSGSRGLGKDILFKYTGQYGGAGTSLNDDAGKTYLENHNLALTWAKANRDLIAVRFLSQVGTAGKCVCDVPHNFLEQAELDGETVWLQRKGAAPSDRGAVMIPGSRGTFSYLVEPCGKKEASAFSVPHGAGRKWERSSCRGRLEKHYKVKDLDTTELGSKVICTDRDLLFEEAPQAYKKIESVIAAMESQGLIKVIATLRPVLTYKIGKRAAKTGPGSKLG